MMAATTFEGTKKKGISFLFPPAFIERGLERRDKQKFRKICFLICCTDDFIFSIIVHHGVAAVGPSR
jgi:hypothetical protein